MDVKFVLNLNPYLALLNSSSLMKVRRATDVVILVTVMEEGNVVDLVGALELLEESPSLSLNSPVLMQCVPKHNQAAQLNLTAM